MACSSPGRPSQRRLAAELLLTPALSLGVSSLPLTLQRGGTRLIKIKDRNYWRYEPERESAINKRRERAFV